MNTYLAGEQSQGEQQEQSQAPHCVDSPSTSSESSTSPRRPAQTNMGKVFKKLSVAPDKVNFGRAAAGERERNASSDARGFYPSSSPQK